MIQKIAKEKLLKEIEDLKGLIGHLEDEYRKANISEKNYQELKEKYSKKLEEIKNKLGIKKEAFEKKSESEEKKIERATKKKGIFGLFGKKEEAEGESEEEEEVGEIEEMTPEIIEKLAKKVARGAGVEEGGEAEEVVEEKGEAPISIEVEKLKVMIDAIREANRAMEESLRGFSESIGELRSMVFQTEGANKEISFKLEKIEDEISQIEPKKIEKKFSEINSLIERQEMKIEKLEKISQDLASKINEVHKTLKSIGGIENLVNLNKDIKKKVEEMKEALKYTERLALKTEKIFIDLSKSLEDFSIYKVKQESLDELTKDLIKSVDEFNLKLENFPTKKDFEIVKGDILVIQKQIEEINKVLPLIQTKIPEPIAMLKREREDVLLFLDSLEEQLKKGAISLGEYENIRKENLARLKEIDEELEDKWKKIIEALSSEEAPKIEEKEEVERVEEKKHKEPEKKVEVKDEKTAREEMVEILKKIKERVK